MPVLAITINLQGAEAAGRSKESGALISKRPMHALREGNGFEPVVPQMKGLARYLMHQSPQQGPSGGAGWVFDSKRSAGPPSLEDKTNAEASQGVGPLYLDQVAPL